MTAGRRRLLAEDQSTVTRHGTDGHRENGHRGAGAGAGAGAGGVQSGHEQNITLIMIIVILVFMLCNAPARLVQVYCTQIIIQSIQSLFVSGNTRSSATAEKQRVSCPHGGG